MGIVLKSFCSFSFSGLPGRFGTEYSLSFMLFDMLVAIDQGRLNQCFLPLYKLVSKHVIMQIRLLGFLLWVAAAGDWTRVEKVAMTSWAGGLEKL